MSSFLLEVGTEELPAAFVASAIEQWKVRIPQSFAELKLEPSGIEFYGTPRRLAVLVKGLPLQQADQTEEVKGPPAQAAFKDGQPTKAAEGFAQKQGVAVTDLEIRPTDKGDFVFVQKQIAGRPVAELLTELVPQWVMGLDGKRLMRWGNGDVRFSRPVRWLVALIDDTVLPITLTNGAEAVYSSDRLSAGHRVLHPEPISIATADDYVATLRKAFIEVDPAQREQTIVTQAKAAAAEIGGVATINPDLLAEVVNLVEYPSAVVGKFDDEFLELPAEVAVTEMESHQRYFSVRKGENSAELLPYFITISNGDPAKATIIAQGNQRVIRARLSDGKFFFDADRKEKLESFLPKLETVTFQADLGSMRAKADRIMVIAGHLCDQLAITGTQRQSIERAALLSKADLVTQMVGEFPELQGVMGEKYARHSGEGEEVAIAIMEHYLPKGAGDSLPQTLAGQVVGLSDRLDTLVSIFSLNMIPSGSSDPFALRRAANAIVNITWAANLQIDLLALLETIIQQFSQQYESVMKLKADTLLVALKDFFLQRVQTLLKEEHSIDYDLVNAVVGENDADYADRALRDLVNVRDRAVFLQTIRQDGRLAPIYAVVNRASKLAAQGTLDFQQTDVTAVVKPSLFQKSSEQAFYDALTQLQTQTDYDQLVSSLAAIAPTLTQFFDGEDSVLVMDKDPAIKQNRLNLLGVLRNRARVLADFGAIVKS
ncbi:glycine--tRNA ligase subunit beta [Alkalinema sp. FACHB-956]|uniref:glycine--tRNA ligase subunit beta n=1 Tax=Alkalinema sp. FACHB-956 TaxID=2692768 RepID=UPI0016899326|nr:glycine--tRNA ligase subunit beta [Alkalinema sp. FACHB-956]MBD2325508.1 glycine--tRNA ligase subunit beta [Alkalinema sp. FACHB-956]